VLAQFALELPVANGFAHDFAGGGVLVGFDRGLERGHPFARKRHADFFDGRHLEWPCWWNGLSRSVVRSLSLQPRISFRLRGRFPALLLTYAR
jgi:hypothetical protein